MAQRPIDSGDDEDSVATRGRGGADGGGGKGRKGRGGGGDGDDPMPPMDAPLADEAQRRYLNYAVSVITSRALPDVRDGLKPVQRRILYAMYANLHLYPDTKFRKCAAIVGEVLGKYHPHGDTAAYEALVRMAQDFSLRYPLVEGHGNFGSLDGDAAAAMRYTEARLAPLSMELLDEIDQGTVDFRPNYDGSVNEPVVLPARVPQLLINGSAGIAVGMATNIPPHNLVEIVNATIALIEDRDLQTKDLLKYVKAPDFPTGGLIVNSKKELRDMYETGQGPVKLRGEWKTEEVKRGEQIVITSIPFNVTKSTLVERIAEVILEKKLPMLTDVRDESTAEVRIVLELKAGADPNLVMAYLYKHTPMEVSFHVNLTCLVPTQNREIAGPMRLDLAGMLREWLDFRDEVVTRRFQFELAALKKRIHILEGFRTVFDALDEIIRIIRKSDGKADAAEKIMARFKLDAEQTDAILELKLYKLARLEIQVILDELKEKKTAAKEIEAILADKRRLWKVIRKELEEIAAKFSEKRRTKISGGGDEVEFQAEDFIVDEEVTVVLSRDGWLKRVRELKDISSTRVREGDAVLTAVRGSTKEPLAIFTNRGSCYVMRIHDVPASTGYGEPLQKLFNFDDGERVIGAQIVSERVTPKNLLFVAVTKQGFGMRFNLEAHRELSTRSGRRFAKLGEGDEVIGVSETRNEKKAKDILAVVTVDGRALLCYTEEISELAGPGRGVTVIKLDEGDAVLGMGVAKEGADEIVFAETEGGKKLPVGPGHDEVASRGGKGRQIAKRTKIVRVISAETGDAPNGKLLN